jgi:sugar lactone lactonase YvrE
MTRRHLLSALAATALPARRLSAQTRRVRTVAGTGAPGYEPEGASGAEARRTPITNPYGIVAGPDGSLYFCEVDGGRTRRLDLTTGRLITIAGSGRKAYEGDGGPALDASFSAPHEIRFDADRHLFVVERDAHVVRRIDAVTRTVTTVAGRGTPGFSGDGGPANRAELRQPHSIAFDAAGTLLICDIGNHRIRRVDPRTGVMATFAGTGERRTTPDEAALEGTPLNGPRSIDTDGQGTIFLVLREGNAVVAIDQRTRRLRRIAGTGATGFTGDGGPAVAATFNGPKGVAWAPDGRLYIVDTENHAIRRIDLATRVIDTVLGTGERGDGPDGDPRACRLARPHGVVVHRGSVYVTDSENHRIRALEQS